MDVRGEVGVPLVQPLAVMVGVLNVLTHPKYNSLKTDADPAAVTENVVEKPLLALAVVAVSKALYPVAAATAIAAVVVLADAGDVYVIVSEVVNAVPTKL